MIDQYVLFNSSLGYAPHVPIILVGTKIDLRDDRSTCRQLAEKNQRPLTPSEGEYLARLCSARAYLECSSVLNFNIRNVFEQAIEVHLTHELRTKHGRRILSEKLHSCSWLDSLLCCTSGGEQRRSSSKERRAKVNRYAI